jgi:hypothetical protein
MNLDVYTRTWNQVDLLPFFLTRYGAVARRIIALDDGSDDGTLKLLAAHPKAEVHHTPGGLDSYELFSTRWCNEVWKQAPDADWVAMVDLDEIIGPRLAESLERHTAAGHTVLQPKGFDMVANSPDPSEATLGVPDRWYNKPILFRPGHITAVDFAPGRHAAEFEGEVVLCEPDDLVLRHYRFLGREETWARFKALDTKRRPGDRAKGFGVHYGWTRQEFDAVFDRALAGARPIAP